MLNLKRKRPGNETVQRKHTFFTNKEGEGKRKVNENNSHKLDQGHQLIVQKALTLNSTHWFYSSRCKSSSSS